LIIIHKDSEKQVVSFLVLETIKLLPLSYHRRGDTPYQILQNSKTRSFGSSVRNPLTLADKVKIKFIQLLVLEIINCQVNSVITHQKNSF